MTPAAWGGSSSTKQLYVLLAVFFLVTYGYFFQGGGWNQNGRICLIRSIIHHRTFSIDPYREDAHDPYFPFVNTGDWSYYNGKYYSNKSPGLSFFALLPYAAAEYVCSRLLPEKEPQQVLISTYISTICTVAVCGVIICLTLFHLLTFFFAFQVPHAVLATLACGLGTLLFSYSTTFYSHVPAAALSFLSFALAMHIRHGTTKNLRFAALGAGFAASLAVLIEPSTILMLVAVAGYLCTCTSGRRALPLFVLGCLPAGVVQCWYNTVCFGGPLNSSYDYANDMVMVRINGRLFGWPRLENIAGLLVLPYRGLVVSSPIYLMALPGILLLLNQERWRIEAVTFIGISMLFLLYIAGFYAWHGGSSVGPRYLVPAFPFMFMLTVFAAPRFPKMFIIVAAVSFVINLAITVVGNEIPAEIYNPLRDVIFKNFLEGKTSINPVPVSHFNGFSIEVLKDIKRWTDNDNSFNLGELLFPHHIASVLPLMLFWVIWGFLLKGALKR